METNSFQRIEQMRKLERELYNSQNLKTAYIDIQDRLYRKEQYMRVLDKSVYTNPYFSKCEDRSVCDYAQTEELMCDVIENIYRYHYGKNLQLINYTCKTLCVLDYNGIMVKIPPMFGVFEYTADQGVWIVERSDYGYEKAALYNSNDPNMYKPPASIHYRLNKDGEPRFRKLIYRVKIEHLDNDARTPIYLAPMNIVIGITDNHCPITDAEVEKFTQYHPLFSKPENFTTEYLEELKTEITKSNQYSILVNDPKGKHMHYYVVINNVIVRVPVTHIPTQKSCMSVIFKSPSTTKCGELDETVIDEIEDYDTVFKPCTTIVIKSNKPNLIKTYTLICGTDLKQVEDTLRIHINNSGAIGGYTSDDLELEVQKRTKVYQDKLAIAKQEMEQLKLTNKTQLDRINELEELQKKKLLEYTQYNEMKIAETKLQRELVTTRSKEVSAISDIIKVAAGVVMTIGGALIYAYTNSSKDNKKSSIKDIISGVTCKATQSIFNISNVIKAGINILFRPLSIIGGLFSLLF
jgi:hypothetical protein